MAGLKRLKCLEWNALRNWEDEIYAGSQKTLKSVKSVLCEINFVLFLPPPPSFTRIGERVSIQWNTPKLYILQIRQNIYFIIILLSVHAMQSLYWIHLYKPVYV